MIKLHTFNPHIGMVKLFKGAKAGAISGAIYGALGGPIGNIALWLQFNWLNPRNRTTLWEMLVRLFAERWFWVSIMMSTIIGVIVGLFFGRIFLDNYDTVPGKTPAMKGIVISICQWIVLLLLVAAPFGWATVTVSLGHSMLWGQLLVHFWERERLGKL